MQYTGEKISNLLQAKVDQAYTGYYDPATQNMLFEDVLITVIRANARKYRKDGFTADDISPLIVNRKPVTINNNKIPTQKIPILNISYSGPIVTVILDRPHNLIVGDLPLITGASYGISGLIPTAIQTTSERTFSFDNVSTPTGSYTDAYAAVLSSEKYVPDYWDLLDLKCNFPSVNQFRHIVGIDYVNARGKHYGQPTTRFPRAEQMDNTLFVEPSNIVCANVEITYIKRPDKLIDVEDTILDYGLIYNDSMIQKIINVAAKCWMGYIKDIEGFKIEESLILENQ